MGSVRTYHYSTRLTDLGGRGGRDYGVFRTNGVGLPTWYYSE